MNNSTISGLGAVTTTAGGIGAMQFCLDGGRLSSDTKTIIVALDPNQHSYVEAPEFDVQLPGALHMAAMDVGLALPKHWSIRTSPYLFKKVGSNMFVLEQLQQCFHVISQPDK